MGKPAGVTQPSGTTRVPLLQRKLTLESGGTLDPQVRLASGSLEWETEGGLVADVHSSVSKRSTSPRTAGCRSRRRARRGTSWTSRTAS